MHVFRSTTLALCLLSLTAACAPVDNSGGEPPAGEALQFEVVGEPSIFCQAQDSAKFIDSDEDIDSWMEGCTDQEDARADIEAAFAGLLENETLIMVSAQLGGCIQDFDVAGVYLDGAELNVWMLKEDTSYGRNNIACTDDLGEGQSMIVVEGAADAETIEMLVGIWNPELPGGPVTILGEE
ncbi:MAG: hypothetical protein KDA24_07185 [Deltaproteobacteria bacterium]|nr:hypothetical protein [Deltaproteobacteria bacterium]